MKISKLFKAALRVSAVLLIVALILSINLVGAVQAQVASPTLAIVSPATGASLPAGNITLNVSTTNIFLVPPVPGNIAGQGHLHYYLDVAIPTTPGVPAVTAPGTYQAIPGTSAVWANVAPGSHSLGVQLVNNDHTPLVPPVTATVTIVVTPPPPVAVVSSSSSAPVIVGMIVVAVVVAIAAILLTRRKKA